jgi:antitoxin component HigA of HigAB toxin-antitoxin module
LPKTYEAFCRLHLPRTLRDELELDAVTAIIDLMAGHPLTADQAHYLETLAQLAEAYESASYEAPASLPPHEFLAAHLENIDMTATEWGKLIGASTAPPLPGFSVASASSTPPTSGKPQRRSTSTPRI